VDLHVSDFLSDIARSGPKVTETGPPDVTFDFDQGIPAEETFPIDELSNLHVEVLARDGGRSLEYVSLDTNRPGDLLRWPTTRAEMLLGYSGLRRQVAEWLSATQPGTDIEPDGVILTSGSAHAIALGISAFVNKGDAVIMESMTFPYAARYMEMRGAEVHSVRVDTDGIDPDELEQCLVRMRSEGTRPKMLYTIPTFHMPTGATSPLSTRRRILELADEFDFLVIEDNIYADLRYSGHAVPSLMSLDTTGRVLQSHGFSKIVAPGLRLGWMSGNPEAIAGLASVRQDLGVSQLTCRVMELYLARGLLDPHIIEANKVYRTRRDLAVRAMQEHCEGLVEFDNPEGGFYLWIRFADELDPEIVRRGAEAKGISCRPGERFRRKGSPEYVDRYLRLAFSHVHVDKLASGIAEFGTILQNAKR
jgi:2-aminoadipate transaminase